MSDKPPMYEWYTQYYAAVASSRANALYCERLAGRNLCQHDFTEMSHLDRIIEVTGMSGGQRVLDMGCGNGFIAEYLSDTSGANVTRVRVENRILMCSRYRGASWNQAKRATTPRNITRA